MTRVPTTAEINAIVIGNAAESATLEFKAAPWERNDSGKRECLKDITALANTRGGTIIVGIAQESNATNRLVPMDNPAAETERSRVNDLIYAGVEPRLYGVNIEAVAVEGGVVLAIVVPRSAARPHRVTAQGTNRFYLRNSTGVYEANVADLRNLFLQGVEIRERALRWHEERRIELRAGDIVANIATTPDCLVLHLIPADAFTTQTTLDVRAMLNMQQQFWPIGGEGFTPRFTFDGFLAYRGGDPCHGYTLVQRNGIVEAVKVGFFNNANNTLNARGIEGFLVKYTRRYAAALLELGAIAPIYALATLEGTRGAHISSGELGEGARPIRHDKLALPVSVIESIDSDAEVARAYRAAFDALWNAGGLAGSLQFNDSGEWTGNASGTH